MHKKNADTGPAIAGVSAMQKKEASGTSRPACNPNGANQLLLPKTSRQTALGGRGPIPRWPYAVCSYYTRARFGRQAPSTNRALMERPASLRIAGRTDSGIAQAHAAAGTIPQPEGRAAATGGGRNAVPNSPANDRNIRTQQNRDVLLR